MDLKMMKLVLIDDDHENLKWLEESFQWEENGIRIIGTAGNGKQGLEIIQNEMPDIVITKMNMPIMDGLEMIQKTVKKGIDSRFIVLNGHNEFDNAQEAIQYGVKEFIPGPVSVQRVMEAVKRVSARIEDQKRRLRRIEKMQKASPQGDDWVRTKVYEQFMMQVPVQEELIQKYRSQTGHGTRTKYQVVLIRMYGGTIGYSTAVEMIGECFKKYHFDAVALSDSPQELIVVISYSYENLLYIILNENMKKAARLVSTRLKSEYKMDCGIGISEIQQGLDNIYGCTNQAKNALVFAANDKDHNIVTISNLMFEDQEYHSPILLERRLLAALKTGDAKAAKGVLDEIYEKFSTHGLRSLAINKKICTELIVLCIKTLYPMGICLDVLFQTEDDPIYMIHDQKSIADVRKIVYGAVEQMAQCIKENKCDIRMPDKWY